MSLRHGSLVAAVLAVGPELAASPPVTPPASARPTTIPLRVAPELIAEAAEVWPVISGPENPVWPGWQASGTPLLFYLPGEQDVLVNHPRPPAGFVPYQGPVRFPGGRILVRDGDTIVATDGQNTSLDVNGTPTLVVADPLSALRQEVRALLEDPRPPAEKARGIGFRDLSPDPYDQLALIVHEAFHVFQNRAAPDKQADEMLLLHYPVLSVENNAGFAEEGAALAAALRSDPGPALRAAAVRWLAIRKGRRALLPKEAVAYEDGVEFTEGLAKYTEYRLFEVLEGRTPRPEIWWVRGFRGYADLSPCRKQLVTMMERHMRGEVLVNGDPYGTAPLRMRLYYSGMAVGVLLDRLSGEWKTRILEPETSLTSLVESAVHPDGRELHDAAEMVRKERAGDPLVAAKRRLAEEGRARIDAMVSTIEHGPGTGIVVDASALADPKVSLAFTPFGITVVDEDRTIFAQVPVRARFADGSEIVQKEAMPLLQDKKRRRISFRLPEVVSAEALADASREGRWEGREPHAVRVLLPGVEVIAANAVVERIGKDILVSLRQRRN